MGTGVVQSARQVNILVFMLFLTVYLMHIQLDIFAGKLCRSFIIFWLSTQADDDDPFDSRPGRRSSTDVAPSLAKPNDIIRADVTVSFASCAVLSVTDS